MHLVTTPMRPVVDEYSTDECFYTFFLISHANITSSRLVTEVHWKQQYIEYKLSIIMSLCSVPLAKEKMVAQRSRSTSEDRLNALSMYVSYDLNDKGLGGMNNSSTVT